MWHTHIIYIYSIYLPCYLWDGPNWSQLLSVDSCEILRGSWHLSRGGSKSVLKAARLHRALLKVQTNASQGKFAEVHESSVWVCLKKMKTINAGWWFGTCFIFPYIGNNNPNWLIFFRGVETGLIITQLWPFRTETDGQPVDGMGPISRKMRNRQMVKQQVLLGKTWESNTSSDCWSILPMNSVMTAGHPRLLASLTWTSG